MLQSNCQLKLKLLRFRPWLKENGTVILWYLQISHYTRSKVLAHAKGESDRIRLIGGAEARAVEAVGRLIFMRNSLA